MASYRLFSLGRFLQWAVTATGGLTKRKDRKDSLRKTLDRLSIERQVDPASYERILSHIKNAANTYTAPFDNHWLSGDMWRDAFSAYQYLTVKLVLTRRNPEDVSQILFAEVLSWFARSLLHWYQYATKIPTAYSDDLSWFTHKGRGGDVIGFNRALNRLKSSLVGLPNGGSLEFARIILAAEGRSLNDDTIRDQAKQIREWETGIHFPDTMRIEDLCASLKHVTNTKYFGINIHPNRMRRSADEFLEGFYVSTFIKSIASLSQLFVINPDRVPHPHEWFIHVAARDRHISINDSPLVLQGVPSHFKMGAPDRNSYIRDCVQQPIDSAGHIEYGVYSDRERLGEILNILPEASDEDTLLLLRDVDTIANRSVYCDGPLYADAIRCIYHWSDTLGNEVERNRLQKYAYQQMHLHGLVQPSYSASDVWRKTRRSAASREQLLDDDFYLDSNPQTAAAIKSIFTERYVSNAEKAKIRKWRKDRVDEWIRNRPYRRTRLMLAAGLGMTETAIELIDDRADPCLFSESSGTKQGDRGTPFLFGVQALKAAYLHGKADKVAEIWSVLNHMAERAERLAACIDTPTKLKNYTCLGEAISSTNPELVQWLITLGASLEIPTGGDELTPLYLALNELWARVAKRNWGLEAFLRYTTNHSDLNMQRLVSRLSSFGEEQFRAVMNNMLDDPLMNALQKKVLLFLMPISEGDEERLLSILSILLESGANPDSRQKNGFTPLGYCRQIIEIDIIGMEAAEILKSHGASKVLP